MRELLDSYQLTLRPILSIPNGHGRNPWDMRTWRRNGEKLAAWHRVKWWNPPPDRSAPAVHNPNSTLPIHQNLPWSITSTDSRQCIVIIFGLHHFTIHSQEELLQIKKRPRPQPQTREKIDRNSTPEVILFNQKKATLHRLSDKGIHQHRFKITKETRPEAHKKCLINKYSSSSEWVNLKWYYSISNIINKSRKSIFHSLRWCKSHPNIHETPTPNVLHIWRGLFSWRVSRHFFVPYKTCTSLLSGLNHLPRPTNYTKVLYRSSPSNFAGPSSIGNSTRKNRDSSRRWVSAEKHPAYMVFWDARRNFGTFISLLCQWSND